MTFLIAFLLYPVLCYFVYAVIMFLKKQNLPKPIQWLFLVPALFMDLVLQHIYGTLVFLDLPAKKEWLFTARLIRYRQTGNRYQKWLAEKICKYLLNPLDKCHCCTSKEKAIQGFYDVS